MGLGSLLSVENELRSLGFDIEDRTILHNGIPVACISFQKKTITIKPIPDQIFIQTIIEDQYGYHTYSNQKNPRNINKKTHTFQREYFIPDYEGDERKIKSNIIRGNQFFNSKDGFLFGARVDLMNEGKFVKY